jgi:hypothetical protein
MSAIYRAQLPKQKLHTRLRMSVGLLLSLEFFWFLCLNNRHWIRHISELSEP